MKKGYYLERQKNERRYKTSFGDEIDNSLVTMKLEDMIQYYSGYWLDELSALAKRGKGMLFDSTNINEILKEINSEKVIESYEMYSSVSKVITKYRKVRRNNENKEFSEFIRYKQSCLLEEIDDFLFMNTADILLLNLTKKLKETWTDNNLNFTEEDLIINSILLARDAIKPHLTTYASATLTKKNEIFQESRLMIANWVPILYSIQN